MRTPSKKMFQEELTVCYQQLNYIEDALRFKDDGINTDEVSYLFQCVYEAKSRMDKAEATLQALLKQGALCFKNLIRCTGLKMMLF